MLLPGIQLTFPSPLREYGCYFLSLLRFFEYQTMGNVVRAEVPTWFKKAVDLGYIREDNCFVLNPAGILNMIAGFDYALEVKHTTEPPILHPYIIALEKTSTVTGEKITHFVLEQRVRDTSVWDPLPADRPAAKTYTGRTYREVVLTEVGKAVREEEVRKRLPSNEAGAANV